MAEDQSFQEFLRRQRHHENLIDRFDQQLETYCREHPDASEAEVRAHAELLFVATPGLTDKPRQSIIYLCGE